MHDDSVAKFVEIQKVFENEVIHFDEHFTPIMEQFRLSNPNEHPEARKFINQTKLFNIYRGFTAPTYQTVEGPVNQYVGLRDATEEVEEHYKNKALKKKQRNKPAPQVETPRTQPHDNTTDMDLADIETAPTSVMFAEDVISHEELPSQQENLANRAPSAFHTESTEQDLMAAPTPQKTLPERKIINKQPAAEADQIQPASAPAEQQASQSPLDQRRAQQLQQQPTQHPQPAEQAQHTVPPLYQSLYQVFRSIPLESQRFQLASFDAGRRFQTKVVDKCPDILQGIADIAAVSEERRQKWIQFTLLFLIDEMALFYSEACALNHQGKKSYAALQQWLHNLLYNDCNAAFRALEWFQLETIIPYQHPFDINKHEAIDSVSSSQLDSQIIVSIQGVGLVALGGHHMRMAKVIISR